MCRSQSCPGSVPMWMANVDSPSRWFSVVSQLASAVVSPTTESAALHVQQCYRSVAQTQHTMHLICVLSLIPLVYQLCGPEPVVYSPDSCARFFKHPAFPLHGPPLMMQPLSDSMCATLTLLHLCYQQVGSPMACTRNTMCMGGSV